MHDDDHDDATAGALFLVFFFLLLTGVLVLACMSEPARRKTHVVYCRLVGKQEAPGQVTDTSSARLPIVALDQNARSVTGSAGGLDNNGA